MPDPRQIIADNVARIRDRIAAAALAANRQPKEVKLVAVTKYVDAETAALLLEAGCTTLAESRPQELWAKAAASHLAAAQWHLVGRLQRNKVRRTLPLIELIHSVDGERLLAEINDQAQALEATPSVLLEVNCSAEAAKQGFSADELRRLLPLLPKYPRVKVAGLMTMAALEGGLTVAHANFAALRNLRDELAKQAPPGVDLRELSMGMSSDFEAAIAEGATLVRIGSSLFEGLPQ
jgi:pyridoxal phosphate enzyme (YggS family)